MLAAEAPDWQGAVEDQNEHPRRMCREDQRPQRSQSGASAARAIELFMTGP